MFRHPFPSRKCLQKFSVFSVSTLNNRKFESLPEVTLAHCLNEPLPEENQ